MQVTYEKNDIVHSTHVDMHSPDMLSLFINVNNRERPEWIGHSPSNFHVTFMPEDGHQSNDDLSVVVTFTAESSQEALLLSQSPFTRHCKDQLHFLFRDERALYQRTTV